MDSTEILRKYLTIKNNVFYSLENDNEGLKVFSATKNDLELRFQREDNVVEMTVECCYRQCLILFLIKKLTNIT